jgi:hypothetical protein
MYEHALELGEELVIEGIRLTVLAVEPGEVLLGITAPEPSDVGGTGDGNCTSSGLPRLAGPPPLSEDAHGRHPAQPHP